jgi:outer membrane protein insertion porin family
VVYQGGNTEAFGNTEFTFPLIPDVGVKGVVFFDYGNAFNDKYNMLSTMLMSYGGGIRWSSPIGPLRLEYGIPINPRDIDSRSGRFEFSIGSMF